MTPRPNAPAFDFRAPSGIAGQTIERVKSWFKAAVGLFHERWPQTANSQAQLSYVGDKAMTFGNAKTQIPKPSLAFDISLQGHSLPSFFIVERLTALKIALDMLGDAAEEVEDQALSAVEFSLCEMFIQEFFAAFGDSWFEQTSLQFAIEGCETAAHQSKRWPNKLILLEIHLQLSLPSGPCDLKWLVPQKMLEELLGQLDTVTPTDQTDHRPVLEQRCVEMDIQVAVELGSATLSVTQLADLAPGDVIMLQQKIDETLPVRVEDKTKYQAWPGRIGNQQAVQIAAVS